MLTADPSINIARVNHRVLHGGHDVPDERIISRYEPSLKNFAKLVRIPDETKIVDNSGEMPSLICEVQGTAVRLFENDTWSSSKILTLLIP